MDGALKGGVHPSDSWLETNWQRHKLERNLPVFDR